MTDLGSIAPSLAALGLLALLVGVRSVRMARGAPVSGARLIAFGAVYVVLLALALLADATLLPLYGYAVDAVAIAGAFALAVPYVSRRVELHRRPDGQWIYRIGWALPVVYFALFFGRFALDLLVLGPSALAATPGAPAPALAPGTVDTLLVLDALFSASAGLLLGRNVAVYVAYRHRIAPPTPPVSP